jgi:orotidine-5'-phosphate decarboxylase
MFPKTSARSKENKRKYSRKVEMIEKEFLKEKIIVALDVPTADEARTHIADLRNEVGAFKIGLQLFTSTGASFVREVVGQGLKVFLDVKFHDIPNTVAQASVEVARLGVWMFNLHAAGGGEMLRRSVEAVADVCEKENLHRPKMIGVTVLTSSNRETLRETGIDTEVSSLVVNLAELTAKCGLDGVVASPLETISIRENVENEDFLIVTPGIRPVFATFDDQKRVTTPKEAFANGSDYLVIGRPILGAADKVGAVRKILAEI